MASEYDEPARRASPCGSRSGWSSWPRSAVWLAVGLLFATLRLALAFAGYVVVAFLFYQLGKWVGRSSKSDEP